jgi:hypothetical protein
MAKTAKPKPISSTEAERRELLHRLWLAQTRALVEKIETTPATELEASTLNVARQVLSDNGVSTDTIEPAKGEESRHSRILRKSLAGIDMDKLDEFNSGSLPAPDFDSAAGKYK